MIGAVVSTVTLGLVSTVALDALGGFIGNLVKHDTDIDV